MRLDEEKDFDNSDDGDFEVFFLLLVLLLLDLDLFFLVTGVARARAGDFSLFVFACRKDSYSSSPKAAFGIPFVDLALLRRVGLGSDMTREKECYNSM